MEVQLASLGLHMPTVDLPSTSSFGRFPRIARYGLKAPYENHGSARWWQPDNDFEGQKVLGRNPQVPPGPPNAPQMQGSEMASTSTPKLPFKISQIPSKECPNSSRYQKYHQNKCTLGGAGTWWYLGSI